MICVQLTNSRNQNVIAEKVFLANTFMLRLRGLLGRPELDSGEGLWLIPCRQVHTRGMTYPLSVWYLNQEGRVCHLIDCLEPGEISPYILEARSILEFPAGWGEKTGIQIGDLIIKSPTKA